MLSFSVVAFVFDLKVSLNLNFSNPGKQSCHWKLLSVVFKAHLNVVGFFSLLLLICSQRLQQN